MAKHESDSFKEFWPYYVGMHSRPLTRWVHFTGTLAGFAVAVFGVATGQWLFMLALPLLGYATAWPAHWLIERNNPASFGSPVWSLRGDFGMIAQMLRGRDSDLSAVATTWLASHPADRSKGSLVGREPLTI